MAQSRKQGERGAKCYRGRGRRAGLHDEHFYLTYSKLRLTTTTIRVATTTTKTGNSLGREGEGV